MIYVPHSIGLIIATCYKCASNSITNTFKAGGTKNINLSAVIELKRANWKVVGVVRDPIDRFESAYNFFQYGQCGSFPTGKYENIKAFTDDVLNGIEDDHWMPQSSLLRECDIFADLETIPIILKENSVGHVEKATYRLDELKEFYINDYSIRGISWES
tara:strand:+ start:1863 stop:2339 length:477 start_codon:yes stop_codon:yes gene_type:complete